MLHQSATMNNQNTYKDKRRFFWLTQPFLPVLPSVSCWLASTYNLPSLYWLTVIFWFVVIAILDQSLPKDSNNPPEKEFKEIENDNYYYLLLLASTPAYLINIAFVCSFVATNDLNMLDYIGIAISLGIVSGLGLAVGHELGHKTTIFFRRAGKFLLSISGVPHFIVGHLSGHHKLVATPADSSSSRMGENLYHFGFMRQHPGFFREGWQSERKKANRQNRSIWHPKNEMLQQHFITALLFGALTAGFGAIVLPFLIFQMIICWSYLSLIEYCQHYGLKREQRENGTYEPAGQEHSWNTNMIMSNNLLLNFVRHSPHHLSSIRWYQALRDHKKAPELPYCYSLMFIAAMFPPVFYYLMDKKVVQWAKGDLSKINIYSPAKQKLVEKYGQKSSEK